MFFTTFKKLCDERNTSPNAVAKKVGISSGTVTGWKNGVQPRTSAVKKLADYFGVSEKCMLGYEEAPTISEDDRRKIMETAKKLAALSDDKYNTAMKILDAIINE